jgi:hypothetical protein
MGMKRYEDLYRSSSTVGTEGALAGRLDPAVLGVTSVEGQVKKVTGIMAKCANTGYVVGRLAGTTVFTFDMACLHARQEFAPLDIPVPVGQTLALGHMSSSGTAAITATLQYELEGT